MDCGRTPVAGGANTGEFHRGWRPQGHRPEAELTLFQVGCRVDVAQNRAIVTFDDFQFAGMASDDRARTLVALQGQQFSQIAPTEPDRMAPLCAVRRNRDAPGLRDATGDDLDGLRQQERHVSERNDPAIRVAARFNSAHEAASHAQPRVFANMHRDALRFDHRVQTAVATANDRNRFGQRAFQVSQRSNPDRCPVRQRMQQLAAAETTAAACGQQNSNDFHERTPEGGRNWNAEVRAARTEFSSARACCVQAVDSPKNTSGYPAGWPAPSCPGIYRPSAFFLPRDSSERPSQPEWTECPAP